MLSDEQKTQLKPVIQGEQSLQNAGTITPTQENKNTPVLMAENNHITDHTENINNLIHQINNNTIVKGDIIALERKEAGKNFGMRDVKILSQMIDSDLEKKYQVK
jgi:protein involved in polysaccharide export with SLBB domain